MHTRSVHGWGIVNVNVSSGAGGAGGASGGGGAGAGAIPATRAPGVAYSKRASSGGGCNFPVSWNSVDEMGTRFLGLGLIVGTGKNWWRRDGGWEVLGQSSPGPRFREKSIGQAGRIASSCLVVGCVPRVAQWARPVSSTELTFSKVSLMSDGTS